jgi:ABC-2 type transport system permease protein
MNNIVSLTKILLKNGSIGGKSKKGKDKGALLYIIILGLYICAFSIPIIMVLKEVLATYNFSELILSFIIPAGGITSLIFAVFSMANLFYYNKEAETLLSYPVKSGELFIARFLSSLTSQYLVLFMFIFPIIFGVGIGINANPLYYVYAGSICFLMPLLPSAIVAVILMILSKVINLGKRKTLFMYITIALVMIFSLGYGIGMGYLLEMDIADLASLFSGQATSVISMTKYVFPLFNSATYSLLYCEEVIGGASFGTFIGFNILALVILYILGEVFYVKGLMKDGGSKKEKKSIEEIYKSDKGGVMLSLMKKEWKTVVRTPVFMLNIVVMNIIFPILFLVTLVISPSESNFKGIDFNNAGVYLISFAIILFMCSFCGATGGTSAISREGKAAKYMKVFPVSLKKQIDAKVMISFLIDIFVAVIAEIGVIFVFEMPLIYLLLINIPLIPFILTINYFYVLMDLKRPKINWDDESEAIKQNMTVFVGMILSMIIPVIVAIPGVLIYSMNLNVYLVFLVFAITSLLCYILMAIYIKKNENKLFDEVL